MCTGQLGMVDVALFFSRWSKFQRGLSSFGRLLLSLDWALLCFCSIFTASCDDRMPRQSSSFTLFHIGNEAIYVWRGRLLLSFLLKRSGHCRVQYSHLRSVSDLERFANKLLRFFLTALSRKKGHWLLQCFSSNCGGAGCLMAVSSVFGAGQT